MIIYIYILYIHDYVHIHGRGYLGCLLYFFLGALQFLRNACFCTCDDWWSLYEPCLRPQRTVYPPEKNIVIVLAKQASWGPDVVSLSHYFNHCKLGIQSQIQMI